MPCGAGKEILKIKKIHKLKKEKTKSSPMMRVELGTRVIEGCSLKSN